MPLRFLLGIITCAATIAAGLVHPRWYAPIVVQCAYFLLLLYAIKLATENPTSARFPFVAFAFAAMYMLLDMGSFVWTPVNNVIHDVRDALHPPPTTNGKPVLFDAWHVWFATVAQFGLSLCVATTTFFATAAFRGTVTIRADQVVER